METCLTEAFEYNGHCDCSATINAPIQLTIIGWPLALTSAGAALSQRIFFYRTRNHQTTIPSPLLLPGARHRSFLNHRIAEAIIPGHTKLEGRQVASVLEQGVTRRCNERNY